MSDVSSASCLGALDLKQVRDFDAGEKVEIRSPQNYHTTPASRIVDQHIIYALMLMPRKFCRFDPIWRIAGNVLLVEIFAAHAVWIEEE